MLVARRWVIRSSIAAMTCGTQPPAGSSAVFQAAASTDFVLFSVSDTAITSPAEFRQRDTPVYAANTTGRTTRSVSASL